MEIIIKHLLTTAKYYILKPFTSPVPLMVGVDFFDVALEHLQPWNRDYGAGTTGVYNIWTQDCVSNKTFHAELLDDPFYFNPNTYQSSSVATSVGDVYYTHKSGMLNTRGHYHLDLNREGWIQIKSTMPPDGCAGLWLLHDDDEDGWLLPEFDILETAGTGKVDVKPSVFFSAHDGADYEHKTLQTTSKVYGNFNGKHVIDFRWDGNGTYRWYLDGVLIRKLRYDFNVWRTKLNPYIIAWYAVTDRNMDLSKKWEIDYIRILN